MRVADNKTQLRVADPAVAYRNGRQNARLEWGSSNIYGFTYFCGVLPKNFHFLQVLAKKSAGVSWRGVLGEGKEGGRATGRLSFIGLGPPAR